MQWLKPLFLDTIYRPADAAQTILNLRLSLSESGLALAAACCLNAFAFFMMLIVFPPVQALPFTNLISPISMAVMLFVIMGGSALVLYWSGQALKGVAEFSDILSMIAWLQFMRFALQVAGFVLSIFLPGLANLAMMLAGLYGVWILLNFLNVAQGFASLGRSAMTLALSFVGLTVVLSILLSLVGVASLG